MISFIVSSYNRGVYLLTCLASLLSQNADKEIIVTDNSNDPEHKRFIAGFASISDKIKVVDTDIHMSENRFTECYRAANYAAVNHAKGEWLCFPSDDNYYVPPFSEIMLQEANASNSDLVYCDFLYDPRWSGRYYSPVSALPKYGFFDKGCFIIKRDLFHKLEGFTIMNNDSTDFDLVNRSISTEAKISKAPGVLMVHN